MKNKIFFYIFYVIFPVLLFSTLFIRVAAANSENSWEKICFGSINISKFDEGLLVKCIGEEAQPTQVPTEEPIPTATPAPTQISYFEPYPEAPLCAEHYNNVYHGLFDSILGCHYDHTHGDNPHLVDDIFGTDIYSYIEGEVSYPWHTPGENEEIKHKSYFWIVERDLPCFSQFSNGCIIHYRAFVHNDLHNVFSTHHSALVEAYVCDEERYPSEGDNVCGTFFVSGHQATGDLLIDRQVVLDRVEPLNSPRPIMLHYDATGNKNFATWYPAFFSWMRVSTEIADMFGYYPLPNVPLPTTPNNLEFIRLEGNSSLVAPHVISVGFSRRNLLDIGIDPTSEFINYNGFINVMTGRPDGCVEVSEMCAPLILKNVPNVFGGQFQYRGSHKEYDIFFDGISSGWIVFPGFAR